MLRYLSLLILLFLFSEVYAQSGVSTQQEAIQLRKQMAEHHVKPPAVDDAFSRVVFDNFIDALDPDKLYLTEQEINDLKRYRDLIDDELNGKSWKVLGVTAAKFKDALLRAELLIKKAASTPFDFTKEDIYSKPDIWALDESQLSLGWYNKTKRQTLGELVSLAGDAEINEATFLKEKESIARTKVLKINHRQIKRILEHATGYDSYVASVFLRSISSAYDPHSAHFTYAEMQNFITSLSTEGFHFGITLEENDKGDILISELTPGGPAWESGDVHTGDIIEKVRWFGRDWIDVVGMTVDEVNELLLQSNDKLIEFSLAAPGGVTKTVTLRKEKMETEENVVKSFILEGSKRIGYVSLPGFYSAWGDAESSRCANDVAREIIKLKKENIDGLVLDVRHNGGGSLFEAVEMAGIFIDAGPMGVLRDKSGVPVPVKDMNRGTVYDGPLVLLINGSSASASEFLAAALQDHNRAIIVGSKSYGKATGQTIMPMQPGKQIMDSSVDHESGWGYSTITTMQIYRVTGKTAQQKGVTPDIVLPDLFDKLPFREVNIKGALPSDSISKKIYYTALKPLPQKELQEASKKRVENHEVFRLTEKSSNELAGLSSRLDSISLKFSDYRKLVNKESAVFKALAAANDNLPLVYKVTNHAFDQQRFRLDEHRKHVNEGWVQKLSADAALTEAFYIICDYIALQSK